MKTWMLTAAAVVALAACTGGGGKQAMIEKCAKDGQDKKMCECIVTELEKNMDKKAFAVFSKASVQDNADSQKAMMELTPAQQASMMTATMGAGMKCGLGQ
jgi:hypothetical protein